MDSLRLENTSKSPSVNLISGLIEIKGRSIPENPKKFYKPIYDWIKKYGINPEPITTINLNFEYIDTSSSKWVLDLLRLLDDINGKSNTEIKVNWYYEEGDYDMFDLGMHLKSFINIDFEFIETEESLDDY